MYVIKGEQACDSNQQQLCCLIRQTTQKSSQILLCLPFVGEIHGFLSQMASNMGGITMSWNHYILNYKRAKTTSVWNESTEVLCRQFHDLKPENWVNKNKVSSYCEALRYMSNNTKMFAIMSNLQTHYHFKLYFKKVDQHTGGKWLVHGTKRRKDNQLQSLALPRRIS